MKQLQQCKEFISSFLAICLVLTLVQPSFALIQLSGNLKNTGYTSIALKAYSREVNISDAGHVVATTGNAYGLIDLDGNEILGFHYNYLEYILGDLYQCYDEDYNVYLMTPDAVTYDQSFFYQYPEEQCFGLSLAAINGHISVAYYVDSGDTFFRARSFYDKNMNPVSESAVLDTWDKSYTPMGDLNFEGDYNQGTYYLYDVDGAVILGPSQTQMTYSYWNDTSFSVNGLVQSAKSYDNYQATVVPIHMTENGVESTVFLDYVSGQVYGSFPYHMSNINANGDYAYEKADGTIAFANTDQAYWLTGAEPPVQQEYEALENATLYSSYVLHVSGVNKNATVIEGAMPGGMGLYSDGVIGGVPTETGVFRFVMMTDEGERAFSITVMANTPENVEANNKYDIIERIPEVTTNTDDHVFEVTGEFSDFLHVYLDGQILVQDVDYYAEEGSTKITVLASTMGQLSEGSHTINTTFAPVEILGNATATSSNSGTVDKVSQTFTKTVEKSTEPAMPFIDVNEGDWFYDPILFMYKKGTMSGTSEKMFEPEITMNRAMLAAVLYSLADKPATESANYLDVNEGNWFADAVNWVGVKGIDDSVDTPSWKSLFAYK